MPNKDLLFGDVAGVLIWTEADRFDAMLRFYRDILELPLRGEHDGFVNFSWNDFKLTINVHPGVRGVSSDPLRIMVNFSVGDIQDCYTNLTEKGVVFLREPEKETWGGWVATFNDPDGNILQLLQLSN